MKQTVTITLDSKTIATLKKMISLKKENRVKVMSKITSQKK